MASIQDRLNKLREERIAREKGRIDKLREINLKKYNKNEPQAVSSAPIVSTSNKPLKSVNSVNFTSLNKNNVSTSVKNNFHVNGTTKWPITVPIAKNLVKNKEIPKFKPKTVANAQNETKITNPVKNHVKHNPANHKYDSQHKDKKVTDKLTEDAKYNKNNKTEAKNTFETFKVNIAVKSNVTKLTRKSMAVSIKCPPKDLHASIESSRKSMLPKSTISSSKSRESVFDRLYKPKVVPKKQVNDAQKLQTDPYYLKKVIKDSGLILNKRHTVFESRTRVDPLVRRSISAVHFKRISKNEIDNCIHKWSSIGDKMHNVHLKEINEDESIKEDKFVSAVKSERKKVKFMTPIPSNYNTPRPEELQARLKSWLQKRGKCLDSYHHLQCFGVHHLSRDIKPLNLDATPKYEPYDEENKENIELESDSDNDSYSENMNDPNDDLCKSDRVDIDKDKWRRASYVSESLDFNETVDTTITSGDTPTNVDELILGALNDLTELLREGFEWEQCARWLRSIRERFPSVSQSAAYWECRAALEERRGDLPASVQCWEEAIAKGTEHSVVEANLDQLLDKFMQLKISPNSGKPRQVDPKLVDVKNVFKSTIIRFAVQQAKLRQSDQCEQPKYTVTPVRRSARLSVHSGKRGVRTPLQVCTSVRQADQLGLGDKLVFIPNDKIFGTP